MTTAPPETPAPVAAPPARRNAQRWLLAAGVVASVALVSSTLLWQKLSSIQEQLARQSADSLGQASEARATARQAQDVAMETAAKLAVTEVKLSEVALQRSQIEGLIQSLSRSRDENLVIDIESSIRLAQQQAQLTGSVAPLLAALKTAEVRIAKTAQPRLSPLQRAMTRDIARIQATTLSDTPAILLQLDELALLADELPAANAVGLKKTAEPLSRKSQESVSVWWMRTLTTVKEELKSLVRLSKIGDPESALLSPDQTFFLRENFKLRILNARLGLLSRQTDAARADLATASVTLGRYFDPSSKKTQTAANLLSQVQNKMRTLDIPRTDETLAALATAAAGR